MGTGKKKIEIKRREKLSQRMVTFSKRRRGLFKNAEELHLKTNARLAVLVFSPTGRVYTHGNPSFEATMNQYLIGTCQESSVDDFEINSWKPWLNNVDVQLQSGNVEELIGLQMILEEKIERIKRKIGDNFVHSVVV